MAGNSIDATASDSSPALVWAEDLLKTCFSRFHPPASIAPPETSSRLPRIEPVSDARTTSLSPLVSAMMPMISSAALPKVALSNPPQVGPVPLGKLLGRLPHHVRQRHHPQPRQEKRRHRLPGLSRPVHLPPDPPQPQVDEEGHRDGEVAGVVNRPHRRAIVGGAGRRVNGAKAGATKGTAGRN